MKVKFEFQTQTTKELYREATSVLQRAAKMPDTDLPCLARTHADRTDPII